MSQIRQKLYGVFLYTFMIDEISTVMFDEIFIGICNDISNVVINESTLPLCSTINLPL